jgi:trigger factor
MPWPDKTSQHRRSTRVKSATTNINPTRVKLEVEVPFEELQPDIKAAYKRIAGQVTVPGFRKGKVPPAIIDQRIGRPVVLEEAVNQALPKLYGDALRENELEPLGQPEVDVDDIVDGEDLKFSAELSIRPDIELSGWEGIEVEVDDIDVSDDAVSERLDALRSRFGTLTGVDRAAAEGDFVQIDLNATDDGEPVEGGQATGVSYQIGRGGLIDGLDEAITGLSAGDSTAFRSTLVGTHDGQEVDVAVTVSGVKEQELPDLDDEFAQLASEFDTLDELRDDLRLQVENAGRLEQAAAARDKVLEALLEKAGEVPVPEELISSQVEEHLSDGHGEEGHREEYEQNLRDGMRQQFVLDELVSSEEIQPTPEDLTSYVLQQAARSGMDPNQLAQQLQSSGNLPAVVADVSRGRALALVVEKAIVVDASGNPVELGRLREDGSIAPEGEGEFEFAELDEDSSESTDFVEVDDAPAEAEDAAEAADDDQK